MWALAALGGLLLLGAGYVLGSRMGRSRERALKTTLDEQTEKLTLAENEVLRLAALDPVTDLPGQQHIQTFLEREWRRALRYGAPVSLIMVAVDHFRAYNERFGQEAGDACLKSVANALRGQVHRAGDLVGRYGAEEFAIVLGGMDVRGSLQLANRLQSAVNQLALAHPASPVSANITVSFGVATLMPARDAEWQDIELIARAERALSQAKERGRNRIVHEHHLSESTGVPGSGA